MTRKKYQKKIDEINEQKISLSNRFEQVKKEFINPLLGELEEQGITTGTKVLVKTRTRQGDEINTETYFFGVSLSWGKITYVFHKIKKDGTMSQMTQDIGGEIISIRKI